MFILHGRRKARIRRYTYTQQGCKNCGAFDLDVRVYRDYYHVFFVPVVPVGDKMVEMRCSNCGAPLRLDILRKHYEEVSKTPPYLYTALILFAGLVATIIGVNLNTQKQKAWFVANPETGDVYTIRKEAHNQTSYYFLQVVDVTGDTVIVCPNNMEYRNFVSGLDAGDSFVTERRLSFTKQELKGMLERVEINAVDRNP